jgi:hypothetical protein
MAMDNALARHLALATYRSQQGLDDLLELLQNHVDNAEEEGFRAAIAEVDQKFKALLDRLRADHPGLEQDIDDKKRRFGKPL